MTESTSKSKLRIENKKKKMAALLDIAKLNEYDRVLKSKLADKVDNLITVKPETEPSPKRIKIVDIPSNIVQENTTNQAKPPLIGEIGPSGKTKLEGEDFSTLKKMLRDTTKKKRNLPQIRLRDIGENASLKVKLDERIPMFLSDFQHLIMYSQIGPHSPYSPARWCALEKYSRLVNTNILIVENMSLYNYSSNEGHFQFLSKKFDNKLEIITPNAYCSDIVQELSMVPLTGTQMRKYHTSFGSLDSAVIKSDELFDTVKNSFPINDKELKNVDKAENTLRPPSDKFSRTQLLLSGWQMVEENFPLPIKGLMERKYPGYVLTKDEYKHVTPFSPMIAIDCEMCKTTTGDLELTRVSAVDENHKVFYDTLVKPDNKITDYLTKWSGINQKMLKNVTKKLKDVQEDLRRLLPEDAILVGQSLANDLHVLKMMHPYIIDTSVIYNLTGDRLRKTKLQILSKEFLSEKIQTGQQGHCSTEDSLACMKLVQLKLKHHLYYGDAVMNNVAGDLRHHPEMASSHYATSMLRQCVRAGKTANVIGVDEIGQKYKFYVDKGEKINIENISCTSENSNKNVIKKFLESMLEYSLNIAHIRISEEQLQNTNIFKTVDKWVEQIYLKTSNSSLLAVLFGGQNHGNGVCFLKAKKECV